MAPETIEIINRTVDKGLAMISKEPLSPSAKPSTAYRLYFSCDYTGKYIPSTKRRIRWNFGFTNLTSLKVGKQGDECRGEEHEIELVWSVKSGKTRLYWNQNDISHYFSEEQGFDQVRLSWEARSGEDFQIVVNAKSIESGPQYDFLIDGRSFFSLPGLSEIQPVRFEDDIASDISDSSDEHETRACPTEVELPAQEEENELKDLGFRLSIAGIAPPSLEKTGSPDDVEDELRDELTSEVLTNNLESLRGRVAVMIPGTDDLVSRAIINALSDDRDSQTSFSSCSYESMAPTAIHIEADRIWETLSWIELNVDYAPRPDVEEQKLVFMQKQIDTVFMHVRQDNLTEGAAIHLICSVATLLGLRTNTPARNDTIILKQVNNCVGDEDLMCSLATFGDIVDAAVSRGRSFGICRFRNEESVGRVLAAAMTGSLTINGESPLVSLLEQPAVCQRPDAYMRARSEPNPAVEKPCLSRRRSHQRNTITIDTAMPAAPFLSVDGSSPLVSPADCRALLRPNVFASIPARFPPRAFDAPLVSP